MEVKILMSMIRRNLKRRAVQKTALLERETLKSAVEPELPFVTVPNERKYTKTEINRMSTADLKEFAVEQDVENAEEMTGAELKKVLIEKLGL